VGGGEKREDGLGYIEAGWGKWGAGRGRVVEGRDEGGGCIRRWGRRRGG